MTRDDSVGRLPPAHDGCRVVLSTAMGAHRTAEGALPNPDSPLLTNNVRAALMR